MKIHFVLSRYNPAFLSCVHAVFWIFIVYFLCLKSVLYTGMFICILFVPIFKAPCQKDFSVCVLGQWYLTRSCISNKTTNKGNQIRVLPLVCVISMYTH